VNTAGASALALIHIAAQLPQNDGVFSMRVPYQATKQQTRLWARRLQKLKTIEPAPDLCEDMQQLLHSWRLFLARCDGYDAT
jgi:hypothetical protein